jgi:concanavalin A-like lectin/glucanase superfamily protein/PA14 domain-containing protein/peptidase C25-like protein/BACON domain-containing protein
MMYSITRRRTAFFVIFLVLGFSIFAEGASIHIYTGDAAEPVTGLATVAIEPGSDGRATFDCEEAQWLSTTGQPQIPWKIMRVLLPPNTDLATVFCSVVSAEYEPVEGIRDVVPAPPIATRRNNKEIVIWPEGKKFVDGRDVDIYGSDAFWPAPGQMIISAGKMRQWKLAKVSVPMVRYNPVRGEVQILTTADVLVDFNKAAKQELKKADRVGRPFVKKIAANFDAAVRSYDLVTQEGTGQMAPAGMDSTGYTIITTSAIQAASATLSDFVTYKTSLGFTVKVVSEGASADSTHYLSGSTASERADNILSWLQNNYLTDDTLYVLFIGNPRFDTFDTNSSIPMFSLNTNSDEETPTDWKYSDFQLDNYWEVVVGRIPYYGVISDTDAILQKTMDYENAADVDWRRNALLPMVPLDDSTPAYQLGEQIKQYHLEPDGIASVRIYDDNYGVIPPPEYLRSERYPATEWAAGQYGLVIWMTHGWSQGASGIISTGDVPNLDDDYPGVTWQGSCNNSWPEDNNNLAYALLKNGGIGTIGATRVSWYAVGQSWFPGSGSIGGMGYDYAQNTVQKKTMGVALADTKVSVGYYENRAVFNLYGDPSVVVMPEAPLYTVSPTDEFYTTKVQDASFTLSARSYTLKNNSGSSINWTATNTADWLSVPASGVIPGGGSNAIDITLTAAADYLPLGTHTATVTFTDTTNGIVCEREIRAIIQPRMLTGYWKLNETSGTSASDSSGNGHDGTLTHEQSFDNDSVSGQFDNALNFDGVDDYVGLPSLDFHSDRATITAWIKRNGDQKDYAGIVFRTTGDDTGLNFNTNNGLRYHWNNTSSTYNWDSGLTVPDNQWVFVALVVEPTQATIYMYDGILHWATNTMTHEVCSFALESAIGRDRSGREFTGAIDEVRIYNYVLDATAIAALVQGGRAEHIMPFDDAVNVSFPILSWAGGATAVQFDVYVGAGYDAVANATTSSPEYRGRQTKNEYQLPILYKNTDYYWRIDCVDASNNVTAGVVWHFSTANGTGAVIRQVWRDIPGTYVSDLTGDADYPDNPDITDELGTFEAPTDWASDYGTRIYGYLIPRTSGSYTFWIASDDYGELWLSSDHDPAHATRIANVPGWTDSRQWDKYSQQQSNPVALVAGGVYYIQALQKESSGGDNLAVAWQGPGIDRQVIDGAYLSAGLLAYRPQTLVSYWQLDETSGTMANDAAGDNDGTLMGDPTWQPSGGKIEGALDFDGLDDYVSLPNILNPAYDSFSVFAWVKLDAKEGTITQTILQQEGMNGRNWLSRISSSDKLHCYLGGESTFSDTAVFANTGEWHHVGLTYNGTTLKIYIDGQEEASNDVTAESATGNMRLGAHAAPSSDREYWSGLIDDVRFYNYSLNAVQIKSVMNLTTAWWKLDETTGLVAADAAGFNQGNLTNFNDDDSQWVAGKLDGALQFDGVKDYIELGHSASLKPDLPMTMAAWIKLAEVGNYQVIINIDKKDYDSSHRIYGSQLIVRNTGEVFVKIGDGLPDYSGRYVNGTTVLQPDTWYHIAAVIRSPENIRLYINGHDDGDESVGTGGDIVYSNGTSQLGCRSGSALFLKGDIDDVRIFDRALTLEEIAVLARPVLDLNSNGLIDLVDLYLLSGEWLKNNCDSLPISDFDMDCDVDLADYARLTAEWMEEVN